MSVNPSTTLELNIAGLDKPVTVSEDAARGLKEELVTYFREVDRARDRIEAGGIKRPRALQTANGKAE